MRESVRSTIGGYEREQRELNKTCESAGGFPDIVKGKNATKGEVVNLLKWREQKNLNLESTPVSTEALDEGLDYALLSEAEYLQFAVRKVREKTGVDLNNAVFTDDLEPGVLGRYHPASGLIELSTSIKGDRYKIMHVMMHEALHASVRKNGAINLGHDFEEGIVEMTARDLVAEILGTSEELAYKDEVRDARKVLGMTGTTRHQVKRCLVNGEGEELEKLAA